MIENGYDTNRRENEFWGDRSKIEAFIGVK